MRRFRLLAEAFNLGREKLFFFACKGGPEGGALRVTHDLL